MHGSLQNTLADRALDAEIPEVGTGATRIHWSDRTACTIVEVSRTGHRLVVQDDRALRTDTRGMTDAQSYRYERDSDGRRTVYTRRRDGSYRQIGGTERLVIGRRSHYFDYSF